MNIPRWKLYSNPENPDEVWLLCADAHDQFFKSLDGGESWTAFDDTAPNTYDSDDGGEVHPWVDYHVSLSGRGRTLFLTHPDGGDIIWQTISAPADESGDIGEGRVIETDGSLTKRSNIVATEDTVFVFTRTSNSSSGNVRYFRFDHDGTPRDSGWVVQLNESNVRVGATLDASGSPVVVVWHDGASIDYHRWDGSAFYRPHDGLVWDSGDANGCESSPLTREYAFTVTEDDTLHVVWSCTRERVLHARKSMEDDGSWSYETVIDHPQQELFLFRPSLTHRGEDVWMFVALDRDDASSESDIWYRRWAGASSTWGPLTQLTFDSEEDRQPNTIWKVPASATTIPVMFWKGRSAVYTETVPITGAGEVPSGGGPLEAGLRIEKASGADLELVWDPSCLPADGDYGIYEGALGDFGSHVPNVCSTFGATSEVITPAAGSRYFVVVPQGDGVEGSYGASSDGRQRSPSNAPCLRLEISGCP